MAFLPPHAITDNGGMVGRQGWWGWFTRFARLVGRSVGVGRMDGLAAVISFATSLDGFSFFSPSLLHRYFPLYHRGYPLQEDPTDFPEFEVLEIA